MTSTTLRQLAPAAAAGLALSLLSTLPAGAHGLAGAGLAAGASHPLLGLDHLLLLLGVGGAAALAPPGHLMIPCADFQVAQDAANRGRLHLTPPQLGPSAGEASESAASGSALRTRAVDYNDLS